MPAALEKHPEARKEKVALTRAFQAEMLAEHVYRRILTEDPLQQLFVSDDSIAQFWAKPDHERMAVWGKTFNLADEAKARMNKYEFEREDFTAIV